MTRLIAGLAAWAALGAGAQAPIAPSFPPPDTTRPGARALAANCMSCHGPEGRPAPGSAIPPLAARPYADTAGAMSAFRRGDRPGTVMPQIAKGYDDKEVYAIAHYFAYINREAPK